MYKVGDRVEAGVPGWPGTVEQVRKLEPQDGRAAYLVRFDRPVPVRLPDDKTLYPVWWFGERWLESLQSSNT